MQSVGLKFSRTTPNRELVWFRKSGLCVAYRTRLDLNPRSKDWGMQK